MGAPCTPPDIAVCVKTKAATFLILLAVGRGHSLFSAFCSFMTLTKQCRARAPWVKAKKKHHDMETPFLNTVKLGTEEETGEIVPRRVFPLLGRIAVVSTHFPWVSSLAYLCFVCIRMRAATGLSSEWWGCPAALP